MSSSSLDEVAEQTQISVCTPQQARDQLARYKQDKGLPGEIQPFDDLLLQFKEVVVIVDSEEQLQQWVAATHPFQIEILQGVHEHGSAPGIIDAIRYLVIRSNGAEGVIGGAAEGEYSPAASGWTLWVRFYPQGRTVLVPPSGSEDLFPGRRNNILLPVRKAVAPETGSVIPHQQLTQLSPPEVRASMREWMDTSFEHVRTDKSLVSDHATWAMHLDGIEIGPKSRTMIPLPGVTEFAHMHIDGSWHLCLPCEDRWELMAKGWGCVHPGARYGANLIMFYSPRDFTEMEYLKTAVTTSYRYAIGEIEEY